jgi:hypothetical protein
VLAVLLPDVVEGADVGMVELGDGPGLALEALPGLLVAGEGLGEDLEGDAPLEPRVAGAPHLAHAARTQRCLDLVRAQPLTCLEVHWTRRIASTAAGCHLGDTADLLPVEALDLGLGTMEGKRPVCDRPGETRPDLRGAMAELFAGELRDAEERGAGPNLLRSPDRISHGRNQ